MSLGRVGNGFCAQPETRSGALELRWELNRGHGAESRATVRQEARKVRV